MYTSRIPLARQIATIAFKFWLKKMEKENSMDNLVASTSEEDQKHEETQMQKHSKLSDSSSHDDIPKEVQSKFYLRSSDSSSSGTSSDTSASEEDQKHEETQMLKHSEFSDSSSNDDIPKEGQSQFCLRSSGSGTSFDTNSYTNHDQEQRINEVIVPGRASSERFLMEELDRDRRRKNVLEPRITNNNSYKYNSFLGYGYFGIVVKAYDKTNDIEYAIKFIRNKIDMSFMYREIKMMAILDHCHPNIVQYFGHCREEPSTLPHWLRKLLAGKEDFKKEKRFAVGILMEYCNGGTLEDALGKKYPEAIRHEWSLQFLQGLEFIHKFGIMHRDLKPKNILLCEGKVKIGDFGTAKEMDIEDCEATCTPDPVRNMYKAPELEGQFYNIKVDIYSAGCILLMLKNPSCSERDRDRYLDLVKDGILPAELEYGKKGKEMIQKMVAVDPCDRVGSVAEIIKEYYEEKELDPSHVRLMQEDLD